VTPPPVSFSVHETINAANDAFDTGHADGFLEWFAEDATAIVYDRARGITMEYKGKANVAKWTMWRIALDTPYSTWHEHINYLDEIAKEAVFSGFYLVNGVRKSLSEFFLLKELKSGGHSIIRWYFEFDFGTEGQGIPLLGQPPKHVVEAKIKAVPQHRNTTVTLDGFPEDDSLLNLSHLNGIYTEEAYAGNWSTGHAVFKKTDVGNTFIFYSDRHRAWMVGLRVEGCHLAGGRYQAWAQTTQDIEDPQFAQFTSVWNGSSWQSLVGAGVVALEADEETAQLRLDSHREKSFAARANSMEQEALAAAAAPMRAEASEHKGLVARLKDAGKVARGADPERDGYKIGDIARGIGAEIQAHRSHS